MTAYSMHQCVMDYDLRNRVTASIGKEVWANPTFGDTANGKRVKSEGPVWMLEYFMWPIAVDNEAAYAYALATDNPQPGRDPGVIGDDKIQAAIQVHWPADPPPVTA